MTERRIQLLVGVFIFATMIVGVLLATVNEPFTASWLPWGMARYEIGIQLREAPGVAPNTPVRKNGVLIGRVHAIEDIEVGVILRASIDGDRALYPEYRPHVRTSMLGDATIDFVTQPLAPGSQPVPAGTVFRGVVDPNPFDALAKLGDLQEDFAVASRSLANAGDEVSRLAQRINTAFGDETEQGRVGRLLDTTEQAMVQFGRAMQSLNEILGDDPLGLGVPGAQPQPQQRQTPSPQPGAPLQPLNRQGAVRPLAARAVGLQQPADVEIQLDDRGDTRVEIQTGPEGVELRRRLREGLNELPNAIRETQQAMREFRIVLQSADRNFKNLEGFTEPLGRRGEQITDSLIRGVEGLDRLVENFTVFSEALNNREGTIGRLLYDPQVYENLNRLMCNANQVLAQINDLTLRLRPIVNDARVFMDKVAREPGRVITGGLNPSVVK